MEETATAITAVKQEVRICDWAARIEAQQASGMIVQKWCEENEINPKTYYYHLRKLREKCVASATAIVPLAVPKQTAFFPCLQQNYTRKSARAEILNRLLNVSFFLCLINKKTIALQNPKCTIFKRKRVHCIKIAVFSHLTILRLIKQELSSNSVLNNPQYDTKRKR
ncbi:MAG: hypothetical protein K2J37_02175 [Ruminococcus sp.]|nr:hypothetical protein [Ruminococcus sp.]